jgi:type II secretion system protein E
MSEPIRHIEDILVATALMGEEEARSVVESARADGGGITRQVVHRGLAREDRFLEALAGVLGLPYVRLEAVELEPSVLERISTKVVFQHNVIPIAWQDGALQVAASDPLDSVLMEVLRLAAGAHVKLTLSPGEDIARAAKKFYGVGAETVDRMMLDDRFDVSQDQILAKTDLNELDQEASIVKFVNQIIYEACRQGATDIHLEPMENRLRIRYRVDGALHQTPVPAQLARFQAAIISRIKVMANLDIAEKRLPMDGRIGLRMEGEDIDIRVSTMPTVYGESVSLRLLRGKTGFVELAKLGMAPDDAKLIRKLIHRPNGIVLVTGPTGSGKSTSLYAYLHEINTIDVRIMTAEDPIEYEMAGVNQVLVRPDIGLTFAKTLRSFLRQDPDIIMVGEVRDLETAEIAIQASLTGHLVFSTLHTNDAAGSFTRLLDMGVEPFLVASAVEGIVAQRLVRRLCPACRRPTETDPAFLREIGFPPQTASGRIHEAVGCEACMKTGFRGRTGIFEILQVGEEIQAMVVARAAANEIRQKAQRQGMRTLRDDGWLKTLEGVTTIEEVLRVTEEND